MDSTTLAGWVAALAALGALLVAVRYRSKDEGKSGMEQRLAPIEKSLAAVELQQSRQADTVKTLAENQARLVQRMDDHEKHDTARFDEIGGMFAEIRTDIKLLLRGARDQ